MTEVLSNTRPGPRRRAARRRAGLALLVVLVTAVKGTAMSDTPAATCTSANPKVTLPDTLCPLFLDRLAALRPDWQGQGLTLVVGDATPRRFIAHLEAPGWRGEPRGTMQSGGRLSQDRIAQLLDGLIVALPRR